MKKTLKTTLLTAAFAALGAISAPTASTVGSLGLAVAGFTWAGDVMALEQIKTVRGVSIRACKRPGGCATSKVSPTMSDEKGAFTLTSLEPGEYDVAMGSGRPVLHIVGKDGFMKGVVETDRKNMQIQFYNQRGIKDPLKTCCDPRDPIPDPKNINP